MHHFFSKSNNHFRIQWFEIYKNPFKKRGEKCSTSCFEYLGIYEFFKLSNYQAIGIAELIIITIVARLSFEK